MTILFAMVNKLYPGIQASESRILINVSMATTNGTNGNYPFKIRNDDNKVHKQPTTVVLSNLLTAGLVKHVQSAPVTVLANLFLAGPNENLKL